MSKFFTIREIFGKMKQDYVNSVGVLKNVSQINITNQNKDFKDSVSLNNLQNKYIGEFVSFLD